MNSPESWRNRLLIALSVAVFVSAQPAMSAENGSVSRVIKDNALLRTIYARDPEQARALASEATTFLASASPHAPAAREPRLKFRGGAQPTKPGQADGSDILQPNRKDFDENPILKDIYYRSPLASLRMLKRLREAAETN